MLVVMGLLGALLDLNMVLDVWPQQVETGAYVPVQEKSSRGYPSSGMSSCPIGEEELRQSV